MINDLQFQFDLLENSSQEIYDEIKREKFRFENLIS
jgi:hypothetical protein